MADMTFVDLGIAYGDTDCKRALHQLSFASLSNILTMPSVQVSARRNVHVHQRNAQADVGREDCPPAGVGPSRLPHNNHSLSASCVGPSRLPHNNHSLSASYVGPSRLPHNNHSLPASCVRPSSLPHSNHSLSASYVGRICSVRR